LFVINTKLIQAFAAGHLDFIVLAYHREALEVLHPYVLTYDSQCAWSSQLMQMLEANLLYRNHVLSFSSLEIHNKNHKEYGNHVNCFSYKEGFSAVVDQHRMETPRHLKHCTIHSYPNGIKKHFDRGTSSLQYS
jgi:hypothetical protein